MSEGNSRSPAHRLVVFEIEGARYALPLSAVERILPMPAIAALPQAPPIALGAINLGGEVIPVLDLRRRLGFPPRELALAARLMVASTRRRRLALPVDEVRGVQEVAQSSVTSPGAVLPGLRHLAGIVALPDGLLYIHDLEAFLNLEEEARLDAALREAEA